jgi:hypothetical protein
VATNGHDGFLTLRLEDVAPDGQATGGLVLSLRALDLSRSVVVDDLVVRPHHPFTEASVLPVEDGEVYELWVEIVATAATLRAGHALRLCRAALRLAAPDAVHPPGPGVRRRRPPPVPRP